MPKRSNTFQSLIAMLERQLAPLGATVEESALLKESLSKNEREIDVLIRYTTGHRELVVGIECRDHRRKADIHWVEQSRSKFDVLPIHKRVLVSRNGFTKSALERAAQWNIEAISLDQALAIDWNSGVSLASDLKMLRFRMRFIRIAAVATSTNIILGKVTDIRRFQHDGVEEMPYDFCQRLINQPPCMKSLMDLLRFSHDWTIVRSTFQFPNKWCFIEDNIGSLWEVRGLEVDAAIKALSQSLAFHFTRYSNSTVGMTQYQLDDADYQSVVTQAQGEKPRMLTSMNVYGQTITHENVLPLSDHSNEPLETSGLLALAGASIRSRIL